MPCIHSGVCADCGGCEPVCPAGAIFCEDDVPGRGPSSPARTRSSPASSAPPGGAAKTGPLPDDTDPVASYVTSR